MKDVTFTTDFTLETQQYVLRALHAYENLKELEEGGIRMLESKPSQVKDSLKASQLYFDTETQVSYMDIWLTKDYQESLFTVAYKEDTWLTQHGDYECIQFEGDYEEDEDEE